MKYRSAIFSLLLIAASLLNGCNIVTEEEIEDTAQSQAESDTATTDQSTENPPEKEASVFHEDFVFPKTDGSTSTTNLDNAIRSAILGGEQKTAHTKTYTAFDNLLSGKCELIFTTPLSDAQLQMMERQNFKHEAEPIAGEGFVFVVNKDNPVDSLTVEQLKGIYSGEITNWSEVGGNDAEIAAYQRNADSGSQNYMISFMGDTPLMKPVTDEIPATMSGILNIVANYDNGINAIGYSVYAYSDGMYENISEIKYIKVNGVEPSLRTLADGSYPLLGYNYAVFSADESEDSHVRTLVKWIQSDEGQQIIADAGYVPYRNVEGLTLPEPAARVLYNKTGTSGITKPDTASDYYYRCKIIPESFMTVGLNEKVQDFISEATDELSQIDEAEMRAFLDSRVDYGYDLDLFTKQNLINGYLSVQVGWRYYFGSQDAPDYYYDVRTAVFDIYTGERLELSDLFFEGLDFVPLLNSCLAAESMKPYSSFGSTHAMLRDFHGLYEGDFAFTANSIIFSPGTCFADGVTLYLDSISEYMVTSVPRDMAGCIDEQTPVYMEIEGSYNVDIGYAEEKNGITIWYLDKEKAPLSDEVCDKVNAFIDKTYETYFTNEKLLEYAKSKGIYSETISVGPYPDFYIRSYGNRYIEFGGCNTAFASNNEFTVIDGFYNPYYFDFFFNAQTGEELRVGELFADGWENNAEFFVGDDSFNEWDKSSWVEYTLKLDVNRCRIINIVNYISPPFRKGDLSDLEWPVIIHVVCENGDRVAISVPREYIK